MTTEAQRHREKGFRIQDSGFRQNPYGPRPETQYACSFSEAGYGQA